MTTRMRVIVFFSLLVWTISLAEELDPTALRGDSIFMFAPLKANGGVILQAEARFVDRSGNAVPFTKLALGYQGDQACLYYQEQCYTLRLERTLVRALARWILRHRTAAFSEQVHTDDATANAFVEKEFMQVRSLAIKERCDDYLCYVPREFYGTAAESILYDLDFTRNLVLEENNTRPGLIMKRLNGRAGAKSCEDWEALSGSYVNTDVDSQFVVTLASNDLRILGTPYRYYWIECEDGTLPYIYQVSRLADPGTVADAAHDAAIHFARIHAVLRAFEYRAEKELKKLAAPSAGT